MAFFTFMNVLKFQLYFSKLINSSNAEWQNFHHIRTLLAECVRCSVTEYDASNIHRHDVGLCRCAYKQSGWKDITL